MNYAFYLVTDPAMPLRGMRTGARSNEWNMTVGHGFRYPCDEVKYSVNELGCLDDVKQLVTLLKSSHDGVA